MTSRINLFFLTFFLFTANSYSGFLVKQIKEKDQIEIESVEFVDRAPIKDKIVLKSIPLFLDEYSGASAETYEEILYKDSSLPGDLHPYLLSRSDFIAPEGSELRTLVNQGDPKNRINLTILGDGYTESEKEKFFQDSQRITDDLFKENTFASYLGLFNVYAVFVPSKESGLSDRKKVNTAFGLQRFPIGSKRGIRPTKTSAIERALRVAPATDYPIIIANDDYYGGLGGRYAITTRSLTSGSMVLRHELGHNFGNVGEEYDGGSAYFGANFSRAPERSWGHWMDKGMERFDSIALTGAYVWQNLENNPYEESFNFPQSDDYYFQLKISSVGWESKNDVKVLLDGEELNLDGVMTKDRSFFMTELTEFTQGEHKLEIIDNNGDGDNVLAYARGYAYPKSYDFTHGRVAAFNVYDSSQSKRGYRPTHGACLMRDMEIKDFCSVDQENMWLRFLDKVKLIDSLEIDQDTRNLVLKTPEIKGLQINWFEKRASGYKEIKELENKSVMSIKDKDSMSVRVEVRLKTPEIRKESPLLFSSQSINI